MNDSKAARAARVVVALAALAALWKFAGLYVSVSVTTYLFYVAIFALKNKRARHRKRSTAYKALTVAGYLLLVPGIALDWLLNVLSSVVFLDLPARPGELFTHRLTRYLKTESISSFRSIAAYAICKYLLHPWDENHCFEEPR